MKKILVCFAMIMAVSANAQDRFSKGDWIVGMQFNDMDVMFGKNLHTEVALNFNAVGGYFLADKFAVDALVGIGYAQSGDPTSAARVKAATLFVGAGVRYYPVANLFARVGYNGKMESSKVISFINGKVGYDVFLSEKIFFEPAIYYEKCLNKSFFRSRGTENILGLSLGFGIRF
jgi:hypothetical protein